MLDLVADVARRASQVALSGPRPEQVERLEPNPGLSFDALTGVVVLEFRNLNGDVQGTVPTARQLAAYRAAALTGTPLPPGMERATPSDADGQAPAEQPEQPGGP